MPEFESFKVTIKYVDPNRADHVVDGLRDYGARDFVIHYTDLCLRATFVRSVTVEMEGRKP